MEGIDVHPQSRQVDGAEIDRCHRRQLHDPGRSERPSRAICSTAASRAIRLVNRKGGEISSRPVLKSLAEVPGVPDLAVVMTPAETVPGILQELGTKGTRAVVIISAGPGAGADGREDNERWRRKLLRIARPHLLRIVGPNCIGYMAPRHGLNASFGPARSRPGGWRRSRQSGAVLAGLADWGGAQGIGFSHLVSHGRHGRRRFR